MKKIIAKNQTLWKQKEFTDSVLLGILLLALSLIVNHFVGAYVDKSNVHAVNDILLDNLPVMNVNFIVNEGVWLYISIMAFFAFKHPQKIPFGFKSIALFVLIRSIFVSLTHLGPAPIHSFLNSHDLLTSIAAGNDMFFSGHTGMPFLLALVFWDDKIARSVSIFASLFFGFSMILGHLHYSIDVFSAFFITYTIFIIAQKLFAKDYELS
jgi:hypothetical protein